MVERQLAELLREKPAPVPLCKPQILGPGFCDD